MPDSLISSVLTHHISGHFVDLPLPATRRRDPADHLLVWVLEGRLVGQQATRPVQAVAGDLVVFEPHVPHHYSAPTGGHWQWWWVHFGGTAADEVVQRITGGSPSVHLGRDGAIRARFSELVTAAARTGPSLRVDSCLLSLLGLMDDRLASRRRLGVAASPSAGVELAVSSLLDWVNDHLDEEITITALADVAAVSRATVTRMFTTVTGMPPMTYVTLQRMRRAAILLEETDLAVAQVGRAVGFDDPYHFSRRFRALVGTSPSAYRLR